MRKSWAILTFDCREGSSLGLCRSQMLEVARMSDGDCAAEQGVPGKDEVTRLIGILWKP